jgi:outer membrane receptor protein involved in Fe transport
LRADIFSWDVDALRPENAGSGSDYLLAPKFGLAYQFNDALELYANWGRGFHSNDVRAVELSTDPATGDPAEPFEAIVKALGYEAGFRAEPNDSINFSMSLFYLELDSELVFVGDAGTTEPKGGTERYGVETALFWQPTDWFTLDLTAAKTRGRFTDAPSGEDKIPDAHDFIVGAGATITLANSVTGSLRVRHFGDAPLAEDGSVEKGGTTLVNLGVSREIGSMTLGIDVLNLLDEEASDIEYLYESQLPGEPSPVEDIHFHPVEPREVRLHIRYSF